MKSAHRRSSICRLIGFCLHSWFFGSTVQKAQMHKLPAADWRFEDRKQNGLGLRLVLMVGRTMGGWVASFWIFHLRFFPCESAAKLSCRPVHAWRRAIFYHFPKFNETGVTIFSHQPEGRTPGVQKPKFG